MGVARQHAANLLATVGVLSAVPTAAAGLADWSDTYGPPRRIGVVHAAANLVGIGFYAASIGARRRGSRFSATALGLMGMGTMTVGGYLGGHLTFVRGVGVNHTFMEDPAPEWKTAISEDELEDGKPSLVDLDGVPTLLYRSGPTTYALRNRCTHAGGPLNEGEFDAAAKGGAMRDMSMAPERLPSEGRGRHARSGRCARADVRRAGDRRQGRGSAAVTRSAKYVTRSKREFSDMLGA